MIAKKDDMELGRKNKPATMDPLQFCSMCWPHVTFYKEQREVIYSVRDNFETFVPAGNMLGKDFVAGFIAVWKMMAHYGEMLLSSRLHAEGELDASDMATVRVVTTSVKDDQLRVLWGEINRFVSTSKVKLPFIVNHRDIRITPNKIKCNISYLRGMVSENVEGLSGHHATYTLFIVDEASGVSDHVYTAGEGWMKRLLVIGNPNPTTNFFYRAIHGNPITKDPGGDKPKDDGSGTYWRKIIKIKSEDSPNVRLGLIQKAKGEQPTNEVLVPGVITYEQNDYRRENWDPVRQCIGLDAEFPRDGSILMYPPEWLNDAEKKHLELQGTKRRARSMGVDPAEGGDSTCWAVADEKGLIELVSKKTHNTSDIPKETLQLMRKHGLRPEDVYFDRGGGGKQHADRLRDQGLKVNTVAFGETVVPQKRRGGTTTLEKRVEQDEERYAYKNRRAQMYHLLRLLLDPSVNPKSWGMDHVELRRQLSPIPLLYDDEGRIYLPPKNPRPKISRNSTANQITLQELIGCSPDEADAVVLAVYGMQKKVYKGRAGVL